MFNTRNRVTYLMGNRYDLSLCFEENHFFHLQCPLPIYILPDIQAVNTNNLIYLFFKKNYF